MRLVYFALLYGAALAKKERVKLRKAELGSVIAVKGNLTAQGTPQLICKGWSCDPDGPFQEWIRVQQIAAKRFSFGRDQSGNFAFEFHAELVEGCKFKGDTTVVCQDFDADGEYIKASSGSQRSTSTTTANSTTANSSSNTAATTAATTIRAPHTGELLSHRV